MYYDIKVKVPCKVAMKNIFSNKNKTTEFVVNEIVRGRIDKIGGETILVDEEGWGGSVNDALIEIVK